MPNVFDLPIGPQCFNIHSYHAILYGMGNLPDLDYAKTHYKYWQYANKMPNQIDSILKEASVKLPSHRDFITEINK